MALGVAVLVLSTTTASAGGPPPTKTKGATLSATLNDPAGAVDGFGVDVAAGGGVVAVDSQNAGQEVVYLYEKTQSGWPSDPTTTLRDPTNTKNAFGSSIAISESTIAIGAPAGGIGAVYLYVKTSSGWPTAPTISYSEPSRQQRLDFWRLGGAVAVHPCRWVPGHEL
jgi:hypothetical protein